MSSARKLLVGGGLALALWGMAYGFYYAAFVEHQTLDRIGSSLASGFTFAAQRNLPEAHAALEASARATYVYVRQVDAHGHWIGLSMLLIVLAACFNRLGFGEKQRWYLALSLLVGAITFPLGVLFETASGGGDPKIIVIAGSALIILALLGVAVGFICGETENSREG